jgi:hypothetical protein
MIKVNKILELSATGFRIESGWLTCDKFHVRSKPLFKDLKVGDLIDNLTYHLDKNLKNEYVMGFTVLKHEDQGEEGKSSLHISKTNSPSGLNSLKSNSLPVSTLEVQSGDVLLEREGIVLNPQQFNSKPSVQDNIRYGQAVNLAFNSTTLNGFESEDKWISFTFDRADKIYKEFNKRVGGN